jgi:hypothetical protein
MLGVEDSSEVGKAHISDATQGQFYLVNFSQPLLHAL